MSLFQLSELYFAIIFFYSILKKIEMKQNIYNEKYNIHFIS